jgi:hypothetical protein
MRTFGSRGRQDYAPNVEFDLGHTDTGIPFLSVMDPRAGFDDAPPCITRGERGWQMHPGGDGPLYEFATQREAAEFFGSGMIRPRWWSGRTEEVPQVGLMVQGEQGLAPALKLLDQEFQHLENE